MAPSPHGRPTYAPRWPLPARRPFARTPHVGAPPKGVEAGIPGSRDEVRAYAARVDAAIEDFHGKDAVPAEESLGLPDDFLARAKALTDAPDGSLKAWVRDWLAWRAKWRAYRDSIESFSLTGPTPSEAWQQIQIYETDLGDHRTALAKLTGKPLASRDRGPLEEPGGVDRSSLSWYIAAAAVAVFAGAVIAVRLVRG